MNAHGLTQQKKRGGPNNACSSSNSASWCPPCHQFTPILAKAYLSALKAKGLEIVFVSSDRDEASFSKYAREQPWPALPFADRDRKAKLSAKFGVQGIPTLVILDAKTGQLVTKDGRAGVMKDPTGSKLPWTPPNALDILKSAPLVDNKKKTVTLEQIVGKSEIVGLYFRFVNLSFSLLQPPF